MLKRKLIGSILTVGLLLAILLSSTHSLRVGALAVTGTPSPAPSTTPVLNNVPVTVVIASLAAAGTPDLTNSVRSAITSIKGYRITPKSTTQVFADEKAALDFGKANGPAFVVVWAETGVIHFEAPRRIAQESFIPRLRENTTNAGIVQMPNALDLPVDVKLSAKTLTDYVQLQFLLAVADYQGAAKLFKPLTDDLAASTDLQKSTFNIELTFEEAYVLAVLGQTQEAGSLFNDLATNSEADLPPAIHALTFSNLGALLLNGQDFNDAATNIDKALTVDDTLSWALLNRAALAFQQGNDQDAQNDYDTVLQADPKNEFALDGRGWLQVNAGKAQEAFTDLNAAIAADPNFIDAYIDRAVFYRNQAVYSLAIVDCTTAIALDPKFPLGYAVRGGLYSRLGRYTEALNDYNTTLTIDPNDPNTLDNRGGIYETLGDDDKALADFTRAIEISPQDPFPYFDRGHILLKRGDFNGAVLDESLAIQFDTRHRAPSAFYYRAQAYQGLHRWEEAIADYKKYIAASPQGFYVGAAKAYITAITALLTPTPTPTDVPTDTPAPTDTLVPTDTNTPVPPTNTLTITPSLTPTKTHTPIPPTNTLTLTPSLTATKTHTPVPPSATLTITKTLTPVPPTATHTVAAPTKTNTAAASATQTLIVLAT